MHDQASPSKADALFARAIERARLEGLRAAEGDMLAAALAGQAAAARASLSLAMQRRDGGVAAEALLAQLAQAPVIAPVAALLAGEWYCFHGREASDPTWANCLARACVAGVAQAQALVELYGVWSGSRAAPASSTSTAEITSYLLDAQRAWAPPPAEVLGELDGVQVTCVRSFAPPRALSEPLRILVPRLAPTLVVDPRSGERVAHPVRDAAYAQWLPELLGWHGKLLEQRLAHAGAYDRRCGEVTNLLRYRGGQAYRPHLDCLPARSVESREGRQQGGQRLLTQLLGVQVADAGGETCFERLGLKVMLAPGDLLTFNNARIDGTALPASRHAGESVLGGEKMIMSKWVRQTATPYGRELAHTL